ncbi:MAG TPA: type II toxin-antitoxin system prevent-host-death family antitoxin [Phycisphaerae bacterium]|nr:type II toxin-antitoxin system prevent-host-death family antitoxin [Phycisphaerae bacterium]
MNVTAYELKTRCGELIERAAAGEEIVITKRGVVKARMVPADHFDIQKQEQVLDRIAKFREKLAKKGKRFSRKEIKAAIEDGRM